MHTYIQDDVTTLGLYITTIYFSTHIALATYYIHSYIIGCRMPAMGKISVKLNSFTSF